MATTEKKPPAAVYVSWTTFKNAIEQLSKSVIPNLIDRTVFTGMNWAIQNQLFSGLRFLGLTDDQGKPTPDMEALAQEDEDARKAKLKEILQRRYSELFSLNLKKTTPGELEKQMADSYGVSGDTKEKAVRFFTSAADYVGIELSPLFETAKKPNGTPAAKRTKRSKVNRQSIPMDPPQPPQPPPGTSKTVRLQSGGELVVSATLGMFALNPKDRKLIIELIERLETYEADLPVPQTQA
jgi:hypothetical protein